MTDDEIDKAISEFEAVGDHRYGWDTLFREPKSRKFWELLYPPNGAPRELRPITAHNARSKYSAAFASRQPEVHDYWLDGETLGSVTFTFDYLQLHFGLSTISAFSRTSIQIDGLTIHDGEDQFRNRLCGQIGKIVERFELDRGTACVVTFEDQSSISISLKKSDYQGPAAIEISGAGHWLMVE
jgi:hypothetical protein